MIESNETKHVEKYLKSIGVSNDAAEMYQHLLKSKPQTMSQLADKLQNFPSANYRLAYELEDLGLIHKLSGRPMRYEAYPLPLGIKSSLNLHQKSLQELVGTLTTSQQPGEHIELVVGRQEMYTRYEELAAQAKQEIVLYAIGIAFSKSLYATQKAAIKRGVSIRHAVQQFKAENYYIINKWQHAGVKVRHAPSERGFHLMIFDRKILLLSFSDPENTENRISIVTDNKTAVNLFMAQFQTIWGGAREIQ
ncbi:MAG: transcriptional regulator TrmB [Candidatus Saccharibacteria bacterium]|nr:transcriptional regulator TrmB [Candidatus Saccharibacteria bacterium]